MQLTSITWLGWSLLSAVFAAATAILAKLGVEKMDSTLATAIRTSVVVVFTWLMVVITRPDSPHAPISQRSWLFLVLSGLGTGLSWLCYFRALKLGPASRVAPIDKLSVALTILLSILILKEPAEPKVILRGLLIVAGTLVIILL